MSLTAFIGPVPMVFGTCVTLRAARGSSVLRVGRWAQPPMGDLPRDVPDQWRRLHKRNSFPAQDVGMA